MLGTIDFISPPLLICPTPHHTGELRQFVIFGTFLAASTSAAFFIHQPAGAPAWEPLIWQHHPSAPGVIRHVQLWV
jgi:hypothetical protein